MAKVIIFGALKTAELAHFYLQCDSEHEVVAFSINATYIKDKTFRGLPVIEFENIENIYSPEEYHFFIPMWAGKMNKLREKIYLEAKAKGYQCISYVSSKATTFNNPIGENCFILENNVIQPFVTIGNNVLLWSGNHIGHHSIIKDHISFTSHIVLSGNCVVENYCFFGCNATTKDDIHIAEGTLLTMTSFLTRNSEAWSIYKGNPAQKSKISSRDFKL
jgi:sugar O-acyltransferase (sialic acid O-acetyltransferase NeuD family)